MAWGSPDAEVPTGSWGGRSSVQPLKRISPMKIAVISHGTDKAREVFADFVNGSREAGIISLHADGTATIVDFNAIPFADLGCLVVNLCQQGCGTGSPVAEVQRRVLTHAKGRGIVTVIIAHRLDLAASLNDAVECVDVSIVCAPQSEEGIKALFPNAIPFISYNIGKDAPEIIAMIREKFDAQSR